MSKVKTHFRKNYKTKHPAYIYAYDSNSNTYRYIGITHSPITKGVKNIEISNPNPLDKKKSYFRPFATEDDVKSFSRYKYNWKISDSVRNKANRIKKNFKK